MLKKTAVGFSLDECYDLVSLRHLKKGTIILRVEAIRQEGSETLGYLESGMSVEDHPSTNILKIAGFDDKFVELINESKPEPREPFKLSINELTEFSGGPFLYFVHKFLVDGVYVQ